MQAFFKYKVALQLFHDHKIVSYATKFYTKDNRNIVYTKNISIDFLKYFLKHL